MRLFYDLPPPSHLYTLIQYGILVASVMNTISKYLLSVYDLRRSGRRGGENAPPWENKSIWVFYIELATGRLPFTFLDDPLIFHRLLEADNLPHILPHYHCILWLATEYCSRCLHDRKVIHHSPSRFASLPVGYPEYGSALSKCNGGGVAGHE